MRHNTQSGNVFFYILLAIVLFAALSFVVSRGNRGNTSAMTEQQAKLAAQEIIEYGQTVANAVQKLRLRGCSDTQISFENDVVAGYENANAPTDNSCHVFDINGGAIQLASPPAPFANTGPAFFDGKYSFVTGIAWNGVGSTCAGDECTDLVMLMSFLNNAACDEVNRSLGYNTDLQDSDLNAGPFTGAYTYSSTIADELTGLSAQGTNAGCFFRTSDSTYTFAQVLIAR